jgi:hypothetical protein
MIAGIVASAVPSVAITDDLDTDFGVNEWHGTNAFSSATATGSNNPVIRVYDAAGN